MHVFPKDLSVMLYFQEISKDQEKKKGRKVSINSHIHMNVRLIVSGYSWITCFCAISCAFWSRLFSLQKLDSLSAIGFNFYYWKITRWHIHVSTGISKFTDSLVSKLCCKIRGPVGLHRTVVCWRDHVL